MPNHNVHCSVSAYKDQNKHDTDVYFMGCVELYIVHVCKCCLIFMVHTDFTTKTANYSNGW